MGSAFEIVIRAVIIYLFVILAIRLFGKKELAQLSVIDLVFILLISNSVQAAMVGGDTTLWGGMIAATALFIINYLLKLLLFKSKIPKLGRLVKLGKVPVISAPEMRKICRFCILRSGICPSILLPIGPDILMEVTVQSVSLTFTPNHSSTGTMGLSQP